MTTVDSSDLPDAQTFGSGHDGSVDGAEWQIPVAGNQLGDSQPVGNRDRLDAKPPTSEIAEEADLGFDPQTSPKEVHDLGDDEGRHDERAGMTFEKLQ